LDVLFVHLVCLVGKGDLASTTASPSEVSSMVADSRTVQLQIRNHEHQTQVIFADLDGSLEDLKENIVCKLGESHEELRCISFGMQTLYDEDILSGESTLLKH